MAGRTLVAAAMRAALRGSAARCRTTLKDHRFQSNMLQARFVASTPVRLHGNHDDDDDDFVELHAERSKKSSPTVSHTAAHDDEDDDDIDDEDLADMVDTVAMGPSGVEYGGPQRGGKFREPTRFGDWERKGRCSDF
ncbi:hypothetical protein PINS_up005713 [Pythium insidiosum]|nr:hypothetical protein PINS_up005713 [Pythium insidiosum]